MIVMICQPISKIRDRKDSTLITVSIKIQSVSPKKHLTCHRLYPATSTMAIVDNL